MVIELSICHVSNYDSCSPYIIYKYTLVCIYTY
nr:MAG TPA: hypothetical protein [Caudoviricetes sp.]DAV73120.1 MAG TPA: hypothetical protein [Caudoviricetes sp.]DAZ64115.1 MAG TPA: hypothetical protein [Caudoviricetes sp.]